MNQQEDSTFPILRGDSNRTASITITCEGHGAEQPQILDAKRYHTLIGVLRSAIERLTERVAHEEYLGIPKERVAHWKAQRDEVIEVLCCFDI